MAGMVTVYILACGGGRPPRQSLLPRPQRALACMYG